MKIRQLEGDLKETKEQLKLAWNANAKLASALDNSNSTNVELWNKLKEREEELSQLRNLPSHKCLEWATTIGSESERSSFSSKTVQDEASVEAVLFKNKESSNANDMGKKETDDNKARQSDQGLQKADISIEREHNYKNLEAEIQRLFKIVKECSSKIDLLIKMQDEIGIITDENCGNLSKILTFTKKAEKELEKDEGKEKHEEKTETVKICDRPSEINGVDTKQLEKKREKKIKLQEMEDLHVSLVRRFPWMKKRISILDGKFITTDGNTFSFDEVEKTMDIYGPWILFPEEYEVKCCNCEIEMVVSSNLTEDKVRVRCPTCFYYTILGFAKMGFEFVQVSPCKHYQQVPKGTKSENCGVCGNKVTYTYGNKEQMAKMPKKNC